MGPPIRIKVTHLNHHQKNGEIRQLVRLDGFELAAPEDLPAEYMAGRPRVYSSANKKAIFMDLPDGRFVLWGVGEILSLMGHIEFMKWVLRSGKRLGGIQDRLNRDKSNVVVGGQEVIEI